MEKQQHSRRAALGALASAPALAILPAVAVAVAVRLRLDRAAIHADRSARRRASHMQ